MEQNSHPYIDFDQTAGQEIEYLAKWIIDRNLTLPAIFALESIKPLAGIFSAGDDCIGKYREMLVGNGSLACLVKVVRDRTKLEALLDRLEQMGRS